MKTFLKNMVIAILLLLPAFSLFAQKLSDVQKAIDVEQYQKAKTLLKAFIASNPADEEGYFYLGWIYINQDYADSAKTIFNKGIVADPKSALNYVGLGAVDKMDNDQAGMQENFTRASSLAGKKDQPYIFMAKAYLMKPFKNTDADLALLELQKAVKTGAKDPEYFIVKGDAYHAKLDNTNAYSSYSDAQILNPKSPKINVAIGSLWKQADNFDDATKEFKNSLAIDPNYGPAYRELAETDLRWARSDPKLYSSKIREGTDYYKKYLDLTDRSVESEMRYADFLIQSHDYKTLETVANDLAKSNRSNLRVYRYLAYAAYENNNYQAGLDAINKFMKEAAPKRIIPLDYLYLGRLQIKLKQDSLGILNLKKTVELDSTLNDVYSEIATLLYTNGKYKDAGDAYKIYIEKSKTVKLADYFREGMSYYYGYGDLYAKIANDKPSPKADSTLLTKADSAFSYVQQKTVAKPYADVFLYRARIKDLEEPDRNNIQGFAKPFYEKYVALKSQPLPTDDRTKNNLGEAYAYLGSYYQIKEKNDVAAAENFEKAKDISPDNKLAKSYFEHKENLTTKLK